MACDSLPAAAAALSLLGTVVAAIQAYRASTIFKRVHGLRREATLAPSPQGTEAKPNPESNLEVIGFLRRKLIASKERRGTWSLANHRWLLFSLTCVVAASGMALWHACGEPEATTRGVAECERA